MAACNVSILRLHILSFGPIFYYIMLICHHINAIYVHFYAFCVVFYAIYAFSVSMAIHPWKFIEFMDTHFLPGEIRGNSWTPISIRRASTPNPIPRKFVDTHFLSGELQPGVRFQENSWTPIFCPASCNPESDSNTEQGSLCISAGIPLKRGRYCTVLNFSKIECSWV